jgi:hypothetical protein
VRRIALAAGLLCLAGCGEQKLQDVTGTVTYDGKPLPAGVVWFDPDPAHPDKPPQGFAYVKDGAFTTAEKGRGIRPGAYLVRVEGFDGKPGNELPLGKPLFTDFQEKRDMPAGGGPLTIAVPKKGKAKGE